MPLSKKGETVLGNMRKTYGSEEKAKEVFYSSINAHKAGSEDWHKTKLGHRRTGRGM